MGNQDLDYLIVDLPNHTISDATGKVLINTRSTDYLKYIDELCHQDERNIPLFTELRACFDNPLMDFRSRVQKVDELLQTSRQPMNEGISSLGILLSYASLHYHIDYLYFNPNSILIKNNPYMTPRPQKYMIYREIHRGVCIDGPNCQNPKLEKLKLKLARENIRMLREMELFCLVGLLHVQSQTPNVVYVYWIFCDNGTLIPESIRSEDVVDLGSYWKR